MVTPNTSPYKPSPLSFGSPRSSPFKRQSATTSPTAIRANSPASPNVKPVTPTQSPSKLNQLHTLEDDDVFKTGNGRNSPAQFKELQPPQSRTFAHQQPRFATTMSPKSRETHGVNSEILSRLPPAQLRDIREAFQVLDRDNDGQVNKDDVADALNSLGRDSSASATTAFFPPGEPQTINLPTYLNKIASLLAPLSDSQEILNAFAAFDEDDSGQVDLAELRDALIHTLPEGNECRLTESEIDEVVFGFTGRRAFGAKGAKSANMTVSRSRAEVFRYQDFVANINGSTQAAKGSTVNV